MPVGYRDHEHNDTTNRSAILHDCKWHGTKGKRGVEIGRKHIDLEKEQREHLKSNPKQPKEHSLNPR
jgi:hypothetical protein